jgi:quinol monooxygenase YgiN
MGEIKAREGQGEALLALLEAHFVAGIESSAGWVAYQVLRRQDDPDRIAIVEVWQDVEAHRASARAIPAEVISQFRELVADAPAGGYYDIVRENHR